jgi:oxidase EvaA
MVALEDVDGWHAGSGAPALRHHTGAFFSIEGIEVTASTDPATIGGTDTATVRRWTQPIINQPEVGVLGILVKEFDGVLHCLMQPKAEPGNHNGVQISPTVQATRSNYTGRHGGSAVPYLDYFLCDRSARRRTVISDVRQSEQGSRFLGKRNRNMVVEVTDDVPLVDGFQWLTFGQLHRLLRLDDLVNMDARTVLSCLPFPGAELLDCGAGPSIEDLLAAWIRSSSSAGDEFFPDPAGHPGGADVDFGTALLRSCDARAGSRHSTDEILLWVTDVRARTQVVVRRVPLPELTDWHRRDGRISHDSGGFFDVFGVRVQAGGREVARWSQPMVAEHGLGLVAFLVTRMDGVLHVLVHLRVEPGLVDIAEIAPTVQCTPLNWEHLPETPRLGFLDQVLAADARSIRYDTVQSVEGGRFYRTRYRHLVVETEALPEPPDYRWMALHQLTDLARHSHYLNEQARSLLACLRSLVLGHGG